MNLQKFCFNKTMSEIRDPFSLTRSLESIRAKTRRGKNKGHLRRIKRAFLECKGHCKHGTLRSQ